MPGGSQNEFRVGTFASSFVLAVFASTVTLAAVAQIEVLMSGRPRIVFEAYPFGVFAAVGVVTALISLLPVMIASYQRWSIPQLSVTGAIVGVIAIAAVILGSEGEVLFSPWAWEAMSANLIFVPVFGLAGLVGGLTFGLIQKTLLESEPKS